MQTSPKAKILLQWYDGRRQIICLRAQKCRVNTYQKISSKDQEETARLSDFFSPAASSFFDCAGDFCDVF